MPKFDSIPLPEVSSRGAKTKYDFRGMKIGNSKFYSTTKERAADPKKFMSFRSSVVSAFNRQHPDGHYVTQRESRGGKIGIRIWMTNSDGTI